MFNNIGNPISTKIIVKTPTNVCRICLENDGTELINPCKCKFPVHTICLKKWIKSEYNSNPTKCEICKTNYNVNFDITINRNNRTIAREYILDRERRTHIETRRAYHRGVLVILISGDAFLSIYFLYYTRNFMNLYILFLVNFIILCLFGTINTCITNNYIILN